MISKEQIAHDLTMIYMKNKYGIDIAGDFSMSGEYGSGTVTTKHFPSASEPQYIKVGTGEKGLLGIERKKKIQSGNIVDNLFEEMVENYYEAYSHFYQILSSKEI